MAEEIEIGSKAIKQIQQLKDELLAADQALIKLSQNALQAGKNIGGITTPGGLSKSGNDNAKTSSELDALKAKYISLNDTIVKKTEQSRLAEIKLQQAREKSFDSFEKNAQKEAALIEKNSNTYNKTQQQINKLTSAYNDLAVRKERYNNLSANEEMRLKTLQSVTEKYNGTLKTVDGTIGKNGRNVGNYASGYNALGNSINQLTREAPAFANSIQTGFMAVSNNFAALQDSIKGIIAQNRILAAEGKPTVSVLKQLGGATFSWTTLISVGVTLLTIYGAKLVDMALGLGDVEAALKKVDAQQKRYNEGLEQANKNIDHNLILEKNRLKQLGASDAELGKLDKEAAKRKLQNFENTRDINKKIYEDEAKNVLKKKGLSTDYVNFDFKSFNQISETRKRLDDELIKRGLYVQNMGYVAKTKEDQKYIDKYKKINSEWYKQNIVAETLSGNEILNKKRENFTKSESAVRDFGQTVSEINSNINAEETKTNKDAQKAEEDRLASIAELRKKELELQLAQIDVKLNNEDIYYTERLGFLDKDFLKRVEIAKADYDEENRLAKGNQDKQKTALINFQLEKLKLIDGYNKQRKDLEALDLDAITKFDNSKGKTDIDPFKSVGESAEKTVNKLKGFADASDALKKKIAELNQETKNWLGSFSSEFLQNSGFGSLQTFFDDTFNNLLEGAKNSKEEFSVYFNAIAEGAQESFNFISGLSQQNFDDEKTRLQNQYDIALTYAGDNKAAQTKLAEDLEKQKKDIANRENKAKQKQAIFNIAIDTAQGIISALASTPPNVPLSIFIGALGAAQIALVASQKIPQYWMGGTHDGGLMMVNDGKGSNFQETIVTPDGKVMKPQGRNVIIDAPKGTEIFTASQWDDQLNNMLKGNDINWSLPQNSYSGISKADMRDAMLEAIGEQTQHHTNFDANGVVTYINKKGNITKSASNRGNSIKTRFT